MTDGILQPINRSRPYKRAAGEWKGATMRLDRGFGSSLHGQMGGLTHEAPPLATYIYHTFP